MMILHHFLSHHLLHFKFLLAIIIMARHVIIGIVQSQFMSWEVVQMTQTAVPDLLLYHYESLANVAHDKHHTNERDAHFGKYGLGLPLGDIHLHQIWNLRTRMGVMLQSLILSGTGTTCLTITDSFSFQHSFVCFLHHFLLSSHIATFHAIYR